MSQVRTFVVTVREVASPAEAERVAAEIAVKAAAAGANGTPRRQQQPRPQPRTATAGGAVREALLEMGEDAAWDALCGYYGNLCASTNMTEETAERVLRAKWGKVFGKSSKGREWNGEECPPDLEKMLMAEYKEYRRGQDEGDPEPPRRQQQRRRRPPQPEGFIEDDLPL